MIGFEGQQSNNFSASCGEDFLITSTFKNLIADSPFLKFKSIDFENGILGFHKMIGKKGRLLDEFGLNFRQFLRKPFQHLLNQYYEFECKKCG